MSRPGPASRGSPCCSVTRGCNIGVSFHPFVGIRDLSTGRFERRGISVLSRATIVFASQRTVSRFFGLYTRLHIAIPRAVGCFYASRAVTLCVRGCIRCHGHGMFFNTANGFTSLIPSVMGRGARGCLIPVSSMRGSRVGALLSGGGVRRARMMVCHAMDGSFAPRRRFSCSVLLFFDPTKVGSLVGGFPRFSRGRVTVKYFNPTATGTMGSTKLQLSLRTPAMRTPSVATTLSVFVHRHGGSWFLICVPGPKILCRWDYGFIVQGPQFLCFGGEGGVVMRCALNGGRHLGDGALVRHLFLNKDGSFPTFPLHIICVSMRPIRRSVTTTSVLVDIPGGQFGHTMGHGLIGHRMHRTCQGGGRLLLSTLTSQGGELVVTFV